MKLVLARQGGNEFILGPKTVRPEPDQLIICNRKRPQATADVCDKLLLLTILCFLRTVRLQQYQGNKLFIVGGEEYTHTRYLYTRSFIKEIATMNDGAGTRRAIFLYSFLILFFSFYSLIQEFILCIYIYIKRCYRVQPSRRD